MSAFAALLAASATATAGLHPLLPAVATQTVTQVAAFVVPPTASIAWDHVLLPLALPLPLHLHLPVQVACIIKSLALLGGILPAWLVLAAAISCLVATCSYLIALEVQRRAGFLAGERTRLAVAAVAGGGAAAAAKHQLVRHCPKG